MVVRIRLARFGKRHAPFYNIVVAQARSGRNSKPMEVIGTYDPIPKEPRIGESSRWKDIKLDMSRAKYWLGVGAQPSDPVWRLLTVIGLLEPKYRPTGMRDEPGPTAKPTTTAIPTSSATASSSSSTSATANTSISSALATEPGSASISASAAPTASTTASAATS